VNTVEEVVPFAMHSTVGQLAVVEGEQSREATCFELGFVIGREFNEARSERRRVAEAGCMLVNVDSKLISLT
jgi:hypothetical protein